MDAPIVSDVREVPTEFASEGRSARACITFAFHTSLQADSRKLGPLASKSPQIRTLLVTFQLHIFARTTQTAPTSFTSRPFALLSSRPVFPIPHHILSTPTVLMATATAAKPEPALVIEEPDARRVQAQFTRLQMALGLKKAFESDGETPCLAPYLCLC
jgi:hypothetical protein